MLRRVERCRRSKLAGYERVEDVAMPEQVHTAAHPHQPPLADAPGTGLGIDASDELRALVVPGVSAGCFSENSSPQNIQARPSSWASLSLSGRLEASAINLLVATVRTIRRPFDETKSND
jgi:hypothetical protein